MHEPPPPGNAVRGLRASPRPVNFGGMVHVRVPFGSASRPLTAAEAAFLERYFGRALRYERVSLASSILNVTGRAITPWRSAIHMPRAMFTAGDPRREVALREPWCAAVLAHEAVHAWQRQHGDRITLRAAWAHAWGWLRDPYAYPTSHDADEMLAFFLGGTPEQQARMVQDAVLLDLKGFEHARFARVLEALRSRG